MRMRVREQHLSRRDLEMRGLLWIPEDALEQCSEVLDVLYAPVTRYDRVQRTNRKLFGHDDILVLNGVVFRRVRWFCQYEFLKRLNRAFVCDAPERKDRREGCP